MGTLVLPKYALFGTWRQFATCDASQITCLPQTKKDAKIEELCQLSVNPTTAYRILHDFQDLKKGDYVLQNAANSSVGISAIQIARNMGLKTCNIIRGNPNGKPLSSRPLFSRSLFSRNTHLIGTTHRSKEEFEALSSYLKQLGEKEP